MMKLIRWLKCLFFYHDFYVIAQVSESSQHIACSQCKRQWGINHDVRAILPWATVAGFYAERGYKP